MSKRKTIEQRFWPKVDKRGPDDCWEWKATRLPFGYGILGAGGATNRTARAHRVSWEIHNGAIPPGMHVCHKCDNPPCCNPAHLFLGTPKQNHHDMRAKKRGTFGDAHPNAKITQQKADEIRAKYIPNIYSLSMLAKEYGVCMQTIHNIIRNKIWITK